MAKKNKKNSFNKTVKSFLKNNELLLVALGAAASGAALVAASTSPQGKKVINDVSDSVTGLFPKKSQKITRTGTTGKDVKISPTPAM